MSENMTPQSYRRPVIVASTVLLGGIAVSLAFNLKAISLNPNAELGAYASGVLWPMALLLSIELLIHTPWRKGKADTAIKVAVLVFVAGVAAWISYWHGVHVLDSWSYDQIGMRLGPIVPDAAMGLATLALQRVGQARRVAKDDVATTTPSMASGEHVPAVATATIEEPSVATDWDDLETDFDRELAEWTAQAKTEEPAAEPQESAVAVKLTTVKRDAADRILALLADGVAVAELDEKVAAEFGATARSARRWRGAVTNGTARLS